ncbi:monofunctional biosynthetic peptidoglycan transglycosylase [uncultured Cytophaga sp.]|uniref:monofunctional biosynthetic peptidoglycan transglycosylase n=1 Tax=uncultured Cytophaga sp. TaxID=160238 RepID=UPI0026391918|nr:monofunctional biosynthetic peptidoglycan transglycosylase [uncultured Cytophaga sp.]
MKRVRLILITTVLYFFVYSIQLVLIHKFINPIVTPLMVIRLGEGIIKGNKSIAIHKEWKDIDEISPNMILSVMAAEDQNFLTHHGFQWEAIRKAMDYNSKHKGKRMKGGSTISQQTAKNVFLIPSRTWIRKGFETYFTFLIEMIWSKERIMEVYLNIIEVGNGYYGVEAASNKYFNTTSKKLTSKQAASITAILPSPLKWSPVKPSTYLQKRIGTIQNSMGQVEKPSWLPRLH